MLLKITIINDYQEDVSAEELESFCKLYLPKILEQLTRDFLDRDFSKIQDVLSELFNKFILDDFIQATFKNLQVMKVGVNGYQLQPDTSAKYLQWRIVDLIDVISYGCSYFKGNRAFYKAFEYVQENVQDLYEQFRGD